ncbi:MAG: YigZ family protein [Thermanaerothrix sp.]|nr:YigZ family protein [Thermanaerothrix sp.]
MEIIESPLEPHVEELAIKRSRFIGVAIPFDHSTAMKDLLREVQEDYPRATHYCWAYKTHFPRRDEGFSDGGEPSGTAGRPILNAILSSGMSQVAVVVVRYYGGIKLGVRGLIDAYNLAAKAALEGCQRVVLERCLPVSFTLDYSKEDQLRHWWHRMGLRGDAIRWNYREKLEASGIIPEEMKGALEKFLDQVSYHGEVVCRFGEIQLLASPLEKNRPQGDHGVQGSQV